MGKTIKELKKVYKKTKKSSLAVYFVVRALVIVCMILQLLRGDINNALLCGLTLILFIAPFFIQKKFKITMPNVLEIIILLFIFASEILGEINNFYGIIPHWDTMLHTLNGFLAAGVGYSLVDLLNNNTKKFNLSPAYLALVAFCFSMTIGVLWEFFEYGADSFVKTDMQKDRIVQSISSVSLNEQKLNKVVIVDDIAYTILYDQDNNQLVKIDGGYLDIGINDTMKDLLVNFIGAVTFSTIGYLYTLNKEKFKFAENFIIRKTKKQEEKIEE